MTLNELFERVKNCSDAKKRSEELESNYKYVTTLALYDNPELKVKTVSFWPEYVRRASRDYLHSFEIYERLKQALIRDLNLEVNDG